MTDKQILETREKRETISFLHLMLEKKTSQLKMIADRISELNHQIKNFDKMEDCFQNGVIEDLNKDMVELDWNYKIKDNDCEKE